MGALNDDLTIRVRRSFSASDKVSVTVVAMAREEITNATQLVELVVA
eukprot:CAMPEP_0194480496 /NCGR_PEP_ID=MMETSP0253-20130528/3276_1 /TAXON_ID=2966 /ORGANISM="Noctiluca scintillans" /LENGTH=46 /DNA_ID= /DNA_START= /DNA_END= /DNA_ORIENTATION=